MMEPEPAPTSLDPAVGAIPAPGPGSGPTQPGDERVRLALRVVVFLDRLGPPNDGGAAAPESTQQGIAVALSATQGAVSKVLDRLVAASIVVQDRRHVRGRDRRVRVYYLSRAGVGLAREVEQRFGLPSPPMPPGGRGETEASVPGSSPRVSG